MANGDFYLALMAVLALTAFLSAKANDPRWRDFFDFTLLLLGAWVIIITLAVGAYTILTKFFGG